MENIWRKLKKKAIETNVAFTVLAPMEDVTDNVFRQVMLAQGRPDLFMTEFTNCDGLASRGRDRVIHRLEYTENQHPIIAQVWGRKVETYLQAIPLVADMGFDGVDINMGCPVPKVVKSGAGAGLINEPSLAEEIILSVRDSISKSSNPDLAFSVKTRIGSQVIDESWVQHLLSQPIDALILHLRTTKELSKVPAHWELMPRFVEMKNATNNSLVLIGNGDINTKQQLQTYGKTYGVDGLMVGRGIFDDIWIFNKDKDNLQASPSERVELIKTHIELFHNTWGKRKNFEVIKKFFRVYLKNFEGAAQLRNELLQIKTAEEMLTRIEDFQKKEIEQV